jgi:uncharacterized membrane protein
MNPTVLLASLHLRVLPLLSLLNFYWRSAIVLGDIAGFFTNLYNDLTAFALAMATFFFAWAALLYMTANQNENHRTQARSTLYVALSGLALAILAQTIAALINGAALGQ